MTTSSHWYIDVIINDKMEITTKIAHYQWLGYEFESYLKIAAASRQHNFVHLYFTALGGDCGIHEHLTVQQARHDIHQVRLVVVPPQTEPLVSHYLNLQIRRTRNGLITKQTKQTHAIINMQYTSLCCCC